MIFRGGHFPDAKQTLLLKAALSDRLEGIRHFVNWLQINQLDKLRPDSPTFLADFMDSIDKGSQRMLPLVTHNLGEDTHPYFKFLIGTRKNYWVRNKQIAHRAFQIQKLLAQNGIPCILIRGLYLAEYYYENIGHRPMNDGNILIPYKFKEQAVALVKKGIFESKAVRYNSEPGEITHTIHLEFDGEVYIELHWNIFQEYAHISDASDFIWRNATKDIKAGNMHYHMSPVHTLFISLVSGKGFEAIPPFRWVADAKMIVDKSDIDWDEFLVLAKQFHYKPFLKRAVAYLIEQHQFKIPVDFVEKLNTFKVSKLEEKYYHAISANIRQYGLASLLWYGIGRKVIQYKLFFKNTDISLPKYLFSWVFNRIRARLAK